MSTQTTMANGFSQDTDTENFTLNMSPVKVVSGSSQCPMGDRCVNAFVICFQTILVFSRVTQSYVGAW